MAENRVRRPMTLHRLTGFLLRTLATQFLLGMILNLYVTLPFPTPLTTAAVLGIVVLVLHIGIGIAALGLSLRMVVVAVRTPDRPGAILSSVAAVGLIVAFLTGMTFTFGSQDVTASLLMTVGFYVALMAGAILLGREAAGVGTLADAGRKPEGRATGGDSREGST